MHPFSKAKLSEFNRAVIQFLIRCLLEGDTRTLAYLGVARAEVKSLLTLRLGDRYHLGAMTPILATKALIDSEVLHQLLSVMTQPDSEGDGDNTPMTKEGALNEAILGLLAHSAIEGDRATLDRLGVQHEAFESLSKLRIAEMAAIRSIGSHLLAAKIIRRDRFLRAMQRIRQAQSEDECCRYLIRHDAPLSLVSMLFGLTGDHFSNLRRLYNVKGGVGRTREITPEAQERIWSAYRQLEKPVDDLLPTDWVMIYQRSHVPLRNIWLFLQRLQLEAPVKRQNNERSEARTGAKAVFMQR